MTALLMLVATDWQAALDAGGRVVLPPGVHRLERGLVIRRDGVELTGPGATLLLAGGAARRDEPVILVERARGVTLRGFTLDANAWNQPARRPGKAIQFRFAEDALVEDVTILRPYVGLSFRQGCRRAIARRVTVVDYQEDAFDAGGDADEVDGGTTHEITFDRVVARDAPRAARDGNGFEIEDGAHGVRLLGVRVENVAGNGIGLRNHQSKPLQNHTARITVERAILRRLGGAHALFATAAPEAMSAHNTMADIRLIGIEADGDATFTGPLRHLTLEGGRFRAVRFNPR
jgi:hypothetical protein